jgi:hypothetical protein
MGSVGATWQAGTGSPRRLYDEPLLKGLIGEFIAAAATSFYCCS